MEKKEIKNSLYIKGKNKKGILILHGFTSNTEQSDFLFNYFRVKKFTVYRPFLSGDTSSKKDLSDFSVSKCLKNAEKSIRELLEEVDDIFLVCLSFGGNLAVRLAAKKSLRIKGIVALETPVLFNNKFNFLLYFLQPVVNFFGIKFVKKDSFFYRKKYRSEGRKNIFLPIKAAGEVRDFIRKETKNSLKKIKIPFFIIQSRKSDLLKKGNAEYIYNNISSKNKKILEVPIDNHDLNLLDDVGKVVMLEKIYKFISGI